MLLKFKMFHLNVIKKLETEKYKSVENESEKPKAPACRDQCLGGHSEAHKVEIFQILK
jgi:hypothetical protein